MTDTWSEYQRRVAAKQAFINSCVGKRIETIYLSDRTNKSAATIVFEDGTGLVLEDVPDCCAQKYMVCDDDLTSFVGDTFIGFEVSEGSTVPDAEVHEVNFLRIKLGSGNVITISAHNEHNGYYGGIWVEARELTS